MIKLKDLLKESHVWERKFGEPLPTLADVQRKKLQEARKYKLGDKWSKDFDYEGMIKWGMRADLRMSEEELLALFNSYEDVNYHKASTPLWDAMVELKKGNKAKAKSLLKKFNKLSKKEYNENN